MKTLLTFLLIALSLLSCKKKVVQPAEPYPDPQPPVVVCTDKAPRLTGAYYTFSTGSVDTCYLSFIENSCGSNRYQIVNLAGVFGTWAVSIQDRDYYVSASTLTIADTLKMSLVQDGDFLLVSVKSKGQFTPQLQLKKRK